MQAGAACWPLRHLHEAADSRGSACELSHVLLHSLGIASILWHGLLWQPTTHSGHQQIGPILE